MEQRANACFHLLLLKSNQRSTQRRIPNPYFSNSLDVFIYFKNLFQFWKNNLKPKWTYAWQNNQSKRNKDENFFCSKIKIGGAIQMIKFLNLSFIEICKSHICFDLIRTFLNSFSCILK